MNKEEFKTIVDKDDNYVVVVTNEVGKEYVLGHCDTPELYPLDATLEGIDRYYHDKLMDEFEEMGCKFKSVVLHIDRSANPEVSESCHPRIKPKQQ
jgi:hypothetical protein